MRIVTVLEPFVGQLNETVLEQEWFQLDGATAYIARTSLNFLESIFANQIISREICPARPLDLTPLDLLSFIFTKKSSI